MGISSFDIEKFNGSGDFNLWKKKIRVVLIQQNVDLMIENEFEYLVTLKSFQRNEIKKSAYNTLYIHLADNILREVDDLADLVEIWKRLDHLYLTNTLPN